MVYNLIILSYSLDMLGNFPTGVKYPVGQGGCNPPTFVMITTVPNIDN